eukprot:2108288-Ditylum_brightwellii.AAC.1
MWGASTTIMLGAQVKDSPTVCLDRKIGWKHNLVPVLERQPRCGTVVADRVFHFLTNSITWYQFWSVNPDV